MSVRSFLVSRIAEKITGAERLRKARERAERRRFAAGAPHQIDYFHQAGDPYACLLAQVLPLLAAHYEIDLRCHLVSAPPDWAAPEREKLDAYSRLDAQRLAARAGLAFADPGVQPSPARLQQAEAALAQSLRDGSFVTGAGAITKALWAGAPLPASGENAAPLKAEGDALRARFGHYLGGTIHYGGEWYWGLDRLHYLEERLADLGARKSGAPAELIYPQPTSPRPDASRSATGGDLHVYLSFRSPYTYIATARAKALADAYGLNLRLRFVLPMVMRGLPVPPAKRTYITLDAAREARRVGVPFGRAADPVGKPVERGYALLPWAIAQGRGYEFCLAFMRGVWSEGIDAGGDAGLRRIVEAASLNWREARPLIGNDDWRAEAEGNRQELFGLGLWGVPCFRFEDTSAWGQDRLWVIEDALRNQIADAKGS